MARKERKEHRARRRDEEMTRRAIKVVDLLQHAADLGNMDALYTLGRITLVSPFLSCSNVYRQGHALMLFLCDIVSTNTEFQSQPRTCVRCLRFARGRDRKRDSTGPHRVHARHGVSRRRSRRPGQSSALLHFRRTWRGQRRTDGAGVQVLVRDRCR